MCAFSVETKKISDESFAACESVVKVARNDVDQVQEAANGNRSGKCRLLLHDSIEDEIHQMLIVNPQGYIRPHKNVDSAKSWHLIKGELVFIRFGDEGDIAEHCRMNSGSRSDPFLIRLSSSSYHTLIPLTKTVVYLETILGPFKGTTYAPWAPDPKNQADGQVYYNNLCQTVGIEI